MATQRRFKPGQKVVIARALGEKGVYGRGHYFYNGTPQEVPLGTRGTIHALDGENRLVVNLGDRYGWSQSGLEHGIIVHPDELKGIVAGIEPLPGIEKLERHPLLELAQKGVIFVVDNQAYTVTKETPGEDHFIDRKPTKTKKRALEKIGTLADLDELYLARVGDSLSALQDAYEQETWKSLDLEKRLTGEGMDTPTMIAAQVFPYLRDEGYQAKLAGMLGAQVLQREAVANGERKKNPALDFLVDKVHKEVAEYRAEIVEEKLDEESPVKKTARQKICDLLNRTGSERPAIDPNSLMSQAIRGRDVAFVKGRQYELVLSTSRDEDALVVNGRRYILRNPKGLDSLQSDYLALLSRKARVGAIDTRFSTEKIKEKISTEFGELAAFAKLEDYDENGEFGFTKRGEEYYVWLKVPQFAIKSHFDGKCYLFEESRVGFRVTKSGEELFPEEYTRMVKNNRHPLTETDSDYEKICFGSNRIIYHRSGEAMAKRLRQARGVLMGGYIDGLSIYNHRYLGTCGSCSNMINHYRGNIVSEKELQKRGIPIFDAKRGQR